MSVSTTMGLGYYAPGELHYSIIGRKRLTPGSEKAILWHHGAGGETNLIEPQYNLANIISLVYALANAGFTVLSCDYGGAHTWGNTTNQTRISDALTFLAQLGCRTDKVAVWGHSMGFTCMSKWARNNSSKVACLVGIIPAANAQYLYDNFPAEAAFMDAAYGGAGGWAANQATTNPSASAVYTGLATAGIPIRCYYSTDDTVVGTTSSPDFVNLVNGAGGNAQAISMGTGGHTDPPLATIDQASFVSFFEQADW